ncbi:uncharacterized protein LOC131953337 isoform X2 [Physella acuta]|uniref:uncharacterized protein LOC131953337 isoform X2 n=1 Tax=Physella acuta TaxID=109671 RepID=UPI0027DD603C|nr:uncharacterized protein LOC131953337 isoform X2 [Physella acuta]
MHSSIARERVESLSVLKPLSRQTSLDSVSGLSDDSYRSQTGTGNVVVLEYVRARHAHLLNQTCIKNVDLKHTDQKVSNTRVEIHSLDILRSRSSTRSPYLSRNIIPKTPTKQERVTPKDRSKNLIFEEIENFGISRYNKTYFIRNKKNHRENQSLMDVAKLKYSDKIALLNSRGGNSRSLGTLKDMEERYSKRRRNDKKHTTHAAKTKSQENISAELQMKTPKQKDEAEIESTHSASQAIQGDATLVLKSAEQNSVSHEDSTTGHEQTTCLEVSRLDGQEDVGQNGAEKEDSEVQSFMEVTSSTVDAILTDNMPPLPSTGDTTETLLMDWRHVFRSEMIRLRQEANDFRKFCITQVQADAEALENFLNEKRSPQTAHTTDGPDTTRVLEHIQESHTHLELLKRKQKTTDLEAELTSKEKLLAEKEKSLEDYEKEILEVESLLNHRQAICDRRENALTQLDEDLETLRKELEETKEQIQTDGTIPVSKSQKAKSNWDLIRRNLLDRQYLLETTVQKYRSELAAATSTIAGKDILISRLQIQITKVEEELVNKDKRIQLLESKLTLALTEARNLTEHFNYPSRRDPGPSTSYLRPEGSYSSHFIQRRASQELNPDHFRGAQRGAMYRRPSHNADQGEEPKPILTASLDHDSEQLRNGSRVSRKRNSISDNAIMRLTLSTPRADDKNSRGSSACSIQ